MRWVTDSSHEKKHALPDCPPTPHLYAHALSSLVDLAEDVGHVLHHCTPELLLIVLGPDLTHRREQERVGNKRMRIVSVKPD